MRGRQLLICIFCMLVPLLALTGPGAGESMPETALFLNSRVKLTGEERFAFTPAEDGEYGFYALPGQAGILCRVETNGELAAEGELPLYAALRADTPYQITVLGGEGSAFEIMRMTHGRSFEMPITLTENTLRYAKSITSPRDVHWFCFTAPLSGLYTFRTETAQDVPLDTVGYLLDSEGREIGYSDDILMGEDNNFRIFYEMEAGEMVFVRVSGFSNATGLYRLAVILPEGGQQEIEKLTLNPGEADLNVGDILCLNTEIEPGDAYSDVAYSTSDPSVVRVSPEGVATAVGPGSATVTVTGYGKAKAVCKIYVRPIKLTGLAMEQDAVSLPVGSSSWLSVLFTPANATDKTLTYESSNPEVAQVDENGVVTAVSEGTCQVKASSGEGLWAITTVTVTPRAAIYRALVMSEHMYEDGRTRTGAINTAQGMADMLSENGYAVTLQLDNRYLDLVKGIETAFSQAEEGDISLFYINCHGKIEDGEGYFELHDGSRITAEGLNALLADVPGKVVILLDFCQSGAFLTSETGDSPLQSDHYWVFASAAAQQDSYRLGDGSDSSEAGMATVFARAFSEGMGWDLMRDRATQKKADADKDGSVTFEEMRVYLEIRMSFYLEDTGVEQTPQASRIGDLLPLLPTSE